MPSPWAPQQQEKSGTDGIESPFGPRVKSGGKSSGAKPKRKMFGAPKTGKSQRGADPNVDGPTQDGAPPTLQVYEVKQTPGGVNADKKVGRWTLEQLRASDSVIPMQYGTNRFASQHGMIGFGTGRDVVREALVGTPQGVQEMGEEKKRESEAIIPSQMGTNKYASQKGMTGFGMPRDVKKSADVPEFEEITKNPAITPNFGIIPLQSGWNGGASQKGMTGFGMPRDVRGKHLKRLWELEFPEEATGPMYEQAGQTANGTVPTPGQVQAGGQFQPQQVHYQQQGMPQARPPLAPPRPNAPQHHKAPPAPPIKH